MKPCLRRVSGIGDVVAPAHPAWRAGRVSRRRWRRAAIRVDAAVVGAGAARPVRNCATAVRSAAVSELPCTAILPLVSELTIDSGVSARRTSGAGTSVWPGLWQLAQARVKTAAPSGAFVCADAAANDPLASSTNIPRTPDRMEPPRTALYSGPLKARRLGGYLPFRIAVQFP